MQKYPKWLYNESGSVLVQTADEHEALIGDWYESPAHVPSEPVEAPELKEEDDADKRRPGRPKKGF